MRYSEKKKAEIVAFVVKHDEENGRGGQAAAKKKFNVSPISIAKWLVDAGVDLPSKGGRSKSTAKKGGKTSSKKTNRGGRKAKKVSGSTGASLSEKLARLSEIDKDIQGLQKEFDELKASL